METSSLDAIEKSYQDVENRLIKVLETWHASNVSPTCQTIISVLKSIDEDVLAEDLGDIKDCIVAPGKRREGGAGLIYSTIIMLL